MVGRQAIPGRRTASRSVRVSFAVGSIVLEISESAAGHVVWRGAAQAEVDRWAGDDEREDRIRDAADG